MVLRQITTIAVLLLFAAGGTVPARAQNSCTEPPIDTSVIERTWDRTDFCLYAYDGIFDEIISGGVGRDGIPPIDNPTFESVADAGTWLQPQSPVIAFEHEGEARAYPLAILTWHEIVNDVIAETPVAVTFCPLCNAAIVYRREVDGTVLRFGVSGLLRNSDLVMWDDATQSWWQQITGEAIVGTYTGTRLEFLPSLIVGFSEFAAQFPDGQVLQIPENFNRSYGSNPYVNYDSSTDPFLFRGEPDPRLPATERVLAADLGGVQIAYPFSTLAQTRVINDTLGDFEVLVVWQPGATSALDQRSIDESRDVGMAALYNRDLDGQVLTFRLNTAGDLQDEQTGSVWNVFGTAVDGELAGSQLRPIYAVPHFWFAWAAFHPQTVVYGQDDE